MKRIPAFRGISWFPEMLLEERDLLDKIKKKADPVKISFLFYAYLLRRSD